MYAPQVSPALIVVLYHLSMGAMAEAQKPPKPMRQARLFCPMSFPEYAKMGMPHSNSTKKSPYTFVKQDRFIDSPDPLD